MTIRMLYPKRKQIKSGQPLLLARTPTMAFVLELQQNAAVGVLANSKNEPFWRPRQQQTNAAVSVLANSKKKHFWKCIFETIFCYKSK